MSEPHSKGREILIRSVMFLMGLCLLPGGGIGWELHVAAFAMGCWLMTLAVWRNVMFSTGVWMICVISGMFVPLWNPALIGK